MNRENIWGSSSANVNFYSNMEPAVVNFNVPSLFGAKDDAMLNCEETMRLPAGDGGIIRT